MTGMIQNIFSNYNGIKLEINACVLCMQAKSFQWCPALCDSMDYSPPGSSVHGSLQARVLEWGAIAFSVHLYEFEPTLGTHISRIQRFLFLHD